jgi:Flp pilus assembly protein TadD
VVVPARAAAPEPVAMASPPAASATAPVAVAPPRRANPEVVPTSPVDRARALTGAGAPDDAIALLRPALAKGDPAVRAAMVDALVASAAKLTTTYNWTQVARRAREALALAGPSEPSRGAHGLLGDALAAQGDAAGAIAEYQRALAETPRDARLKRHLMRARRLLQPPPERPPPERPPPETAASAPPEPPAE